MATTTNYSWVTPDDTSLVKDGAAAIRTLGSSIDTTTKALNPSTTLGDVEYRSATANTNTRLGIGTTGQVLSVVGGVPAWATVSAGGMTLISTITASAASSVSFTSIPGTYTNLLLTWEKVFSSVADTDYWGIRFNNDTTADRHYQNGVGGSAGSPIATGITGTSFGENSQKAPILGAYNASDLYGYNCYGQMLVFNYADAARGTNATYTTSARTSAGANRMWTANCVYETTSAITQIDFIRNSTQTVTGTFRLYGVS
jgi:hypothetical protein